MEEQGDLLTPVEIESYVEDISRSDPKDLGTLAWLQKHQRIKQLTVQAVTQAISASKEETVKDCLTSYEKIPDLVADLVLVEVWRLQILPKMLPYLEEMNEIPSFSVYPILYHESAIINLLETVLYHSGTAETLGDAALDLLDYCVRNLWDFLQIGACSEEEEEDEEADSDNNNDAKDGRKMTPTPKALKATLRSQLSSLQLGNSMKCLSVLRYLIENLEQLGHGVASRLVISQDTPLLLTELLVQKPWRKENWKTGKVQDFDPVSGTWKEVDPDSRFLISNAEAQAWLSLYLMLKSNETLAAYELFESRKQNLMKLRPYLNEVTLDQIPVLAELARFLNELSVVQGPIFPSKKGLLLEMVPEIRTSLDLLFEQKKEEFVDHYTRELIFCEKDLLLEKAKLLASAYDLDSYQSALPVTQNCAFCSKPAEKKCSKCKQIWYCGKTCQVSDWKKGHRDVCKED